MVLVGDQTILAVEAATSALSVGIKRGGRGLGLIWQDSGRPNGDHLLILIDQLLSDTGIAKSELEGIAVSQGPGSFTGVRIQLAQCQAMALGLGLPLYGADRLALAASTLPYYPGRIKVIQNAHKGELYLGVFDGQGAKPERLGELTLITPQDFMEQLEPGEMVLGEGIDILEQLGYDPNTCGARFDRSAARQVNALVLADWFADQPPLSYQPCPLEPIYLRPSEAEILYERKWG